MINIRKIGVFILFILLTHFIYSQSIEEVVDIGGTQTNNSAANLGFGGCATSVLQYATSTSVNPAILGLLENSYYIFTPSISVNNSKNSFNNVQNSTSKGGLKSNFMGIYMKSQVVEVNNKKNKPKNFVNIGITYFKSKDFSQKTILEYSNPNSSITESFAYESKGKLFLNSIVDENNMKTVYEMAFMSYLTDSDTSTGAINTAIASGNVFQNYSKTRKGGIHNLEFSLGKAEGSKFSLGITGGLNIYSKTTSFNFEEKDLNDDYLYYNSLNLSENTQETGSGFYYKIGALYKITKDFTSGLSYTSSSRIRILNDYEATLQTQYTNHPVFVSYISPETNVDYRIYRQQSVYILKTPSNFSFGLNYGNKKWGFITSEINYIQFSKSFFEVKRASANIDFKQLNNDLINAISNDFNIKVGSELNFGNQKARFGIGKNNIANSTYTSSFYSLGYGITKDKVMFNAAFLRNIFNNQLEIYTLEQNSPKMNQKRIGINIVFGIETSF